MRMRRWRVTSLLADSIQHSHSLRASGVIDCPVARAAVSELSSARRSRGTSCTTPAASSMGRMLADAPHPSPFTLHPSPFTLHPSPFTLHPSPFTLHPSPFTLHPSPFTL